MRAITILAPYPTLICLPDSDPRHKRVENRTWKTSYRGPLAIHCGASNKLMRGGTMRQAEFSLFGKCIEPSLPQNLNLGMIVAVADLRDCLSVNIGPQGWSIFNDPNAAKKFPWLIGHKHIEGPICWILENVRVLKEPIPWKGEQGLWEVPDQIIERQLEDA